MQTDRAASFPPARDSDLLRRIVHLPQNDFITGDSGRGVDHACGEFHHGVRFQTDRDAPRLDRAADVNDAKLTIEEKDVDREMHEETMDRLAGQDPDCFSQRRGGAAQPSFAARLAIVRGDQRFSQNGSGSRIDDFHLL